MSETAFFLDDPRRLLACLMAQGWRVVGPQHRDGALNYGEYKGEADLPRGLRDQQGPGRYRVEQGAPGRWFDYVVGPDSPKAWLSPARRKLWSAERDDAGGFTVQATPQDWPRTAFFGIRPCDLAAMQIQARVARAGGDPDGIYPARMADSLIVTVNCATAAPTCFCAAQGTGPRAEAGFDLALTELDGAAGLLLEIGSETGAAVVAGLDLPRAGPAGLEAARAVSARTASSQTRTMPEGIAGILAGALESPRWQEIAERCLHCANCTLACPTCFCSDVEDSSDLTGDHAERWQVWDSCFNPDFSYVHGGAVRRSGASRYRQWMTHKLSTWHDQFDSSGCVGCGRCIAWCPVGIDITAEAAAFAADAQEKDRADGD